jgi:GT2 family glycosyltransferase
MSTIEPHPVLTAPSRRPGGSPRDRASQPTPSTALPTVSVSIVVYHPDLGVLGATVEALGRALDHAVAAGLLEGATFWLVDNGSDDPGAVDELVARALPERPWLARRTCRGHGNVGYGRGHNLALRTTEATYHLVLNPDAIMAPTAIAESLRFLDEHPGTAWLSPQSRDEDGDLLYLCKRYPSVLVLGLRGFAPAPLRRLFRRVLHRYERRDLPQTAPTQGIDVASGCYMFLRTAVVAPLGGFDPSYFMYFEDTDLSLRVARVASIAYVPSVEIVHLGGHAAKKGLKHNLMFFRSAFTFFRTHGWKLW